MKRPPVLRGMKFGKLTPIMPSHRGPFGIYWLCQCDCGQKKTVAANNLKTGNTRSCGCLQKGVRADWSGRRFGKLTVLKLYRRVKQKHNSQTIWLCQCDCGNQRAVWRCNLSAGNVNSCIPCAVQLRAERRKSNTPN